MSRWLLVELEPEFAHLRTTRSAVFRGIKLVSGVKAVTDISAISKTTADVWLNEWYLPEERQVGDKSAHRRSRKHGAT
jgi:hypothetical protein